VSQHFQGIIEKGTLLNEIENEHLNLAFDGKVNCDAKK